MCEGKGGGRGRRYKKMLGINSMSHTLEKDDCDSDMVIDSTIIRMKHMLRIVEGLLKEILLDLEVSKPVYSSK